MRSKLFFFVLAIFALGGCASNVNEPEMAQVTTETTNPQLAGATADTPAADPENTLVLDLSTGGRVAIRLRPDVAPNHVERIKTLSRQGFYNGLLFHRVIEGFMAQTGDPTGTGQGGSSLPNLNSEFSRLPHVRGAVAMARATDPNSANSQFYIMLMPNLRLDQNYTVFGRVIDGMEYVDAIPRGEPPANPARIVRASIQSDNVPPPTAAEVAAVNAPPASANPAAAIDAALAAEGAEEETEEDTPQ